MQFHIPDQTFTVAPDGYARIRIELTDNVNDPMTDETVETTVETSTPMPETTEPATPVESQIPAAPDASGEVVG